MSVVSGCGANGVSGSVVKDYFVVRVVVVVTEVVVM